MTRSDRTYSLLTGLILALLVGVGCGGQPSNDVGETTDVRQDVLQADAARALAMIEADAAKLDDAFHDDLTYSHSNGRVETKAQLVERLVDSCRRNAAIRK